MWYYYTFLVDEETEIRYLFNEKKLINAWLYALSPVQLSQHNLLFDPGQSDHKCSDFFTS